MKVLAKLSFILIAFLAVSCGEEPSNNNNNGLVTDSSGVNNNATGNFESADPNNAAATAGTPQGAAANAHFYCPNNCEGGYGGEAGDCPVCGTKFAHNQAFHNDPANADNKPQVSIGSENEGTQKINEPPQNAAGVWHFTCPNGCAGGSGAAGTCGSCGGTLVHNSVYHDTPGGTEQ